MTKAEVKKLTIELARTDPKGIIASIPEKVGVHMGDVHAYAYLEIARKRCLEEKHPMGVMEESGAYFVFANADRLMADPKYLEEFISMACSVTVCDVCIFYC